MLSIYKFWLILPGQARAGLLTASTGCSSVLDTNYSVYTSFQASGYQDLSVLPACIVEEEAASAESASVAPAAAAAALAAPVTKRALYKKQNWQVFHETKCSCPGQSPSQKGVSSVYYLTKMTESSILLPQAFAKKVKAQITPCQKE